MLIHSTIYAIIKQYKGMKQIQINIVNRRRLLFTVAKSVRLSPKTTQCSATNIVIDNIHFLVDTTKLD